MPDYTLMTELLDFQAEPGAKASEYVVRVTMMMTLIRESDRRIVDARRFSATGTVGSDETAALVAAFDRVLQGLLPEIVAWTAR
jgi:cholesterol transport system auxiliary component